MQATKFIDDIANLNITSLSIDNIYVRTRIHHTLSGYEYTIVLNGIFTIKCKNVLSFLGNGSKTETKLCFIFDIERLNEYFHMNKYIEINSSSDRHIETFPCQIAKLRTDNGVPMIASTENDLNIQGLIGKSVENALDFYGLRKMLPFMFDIGIYFVSFGKTIFKSDMQINPEKLYPSAKIAAGMLAVCVKLKINHNINGRYCVRLVLEHGVSFRYYQYTTYNIVFSFKDMWCLTYHAQRKLFVLKCIGKKMEYVWTLCKVTDELEQIVL